MNQPFQRVNVDFTASMLSELDQAAGELNVSSQLLLRRSFAGPSISTIWHVGRRRRVESFSNGLACVSRGIRSVLRFLSTLVSPTGWIVKLRRAICCSDWMNAGEPMR